MQAIGRQTREWIERGETEAKKEERAGQLVLWFVQFACTIGVAITAPRAAFVAFLGSVASGNLLVEEMKRFRSGRREPPPKGTWILLFVTCFAIIWSVNHLPTYLAKKTE